ncbi:MAG: hypothetical protein NVV68_05590 [Dokdonella sp.]|nr:hypothetical protein [Dokdonella sp.]
MRAIVAAAASAADCALTTCERAVSIAAPAAAICARARGDRRLASVHRGARVVQFLL